MDDNLNRLPRERADRFTKLPGRDLRRYANHDWRDDEELRTCLAVANIPMHRSQDS